MNKEQDFFKSFCEICRVLGSSAGVEEILELIVDKAIEIMDGKAACLFLADEEKDIFVPAAEKGLSKNYYHARPQHARKVVDDILQGGHIFIHDATADKYVENRELKKAEGIASILSVPVMVGGKAIGVLALYTATRRKFTDAEIGFLTAVAEQGGMRLEQARLVEQARENNRLFFSISSKINSSLDVKEVLDIFASEVTTFFDLKGLTIRLLSEDNKNLKLVSSFGLSDEYLNKGPINLGKNINKVLSGNLIAVKDAPADQRVQYKQEKQKEGIASILYVPVKAGEKVIGLMTLYSKKIREFTEDEVTMAKSLALQGGLAIQNASLYLALKDEMKGLQDDVWSHRMWF